MRSLIIALVMVGVVLGVWSLKRWGTPERPKEEPTGGFGPWFHRWANHENTAVSPYSGPLAVQVKWKWEAGPIDKTGHLEAPVVDCNGNLYTFEDMVCYGLSPEGKVKWTFDIGGRFPIMSIAVSNDGTVYLEAGTALYALTSQGRLKWKYREKGGVPTTIAIARDGKTIYTVTGLFRGTSSLVALDTEGKVKWKHPLEEELYVGPVAVSSRDLLYFLGSKADPDVDWAVEPGKATSLVMALEPNGTRLWEKWLPGEALPPALLCHDLLYVVTVNGHIYALDTNGQLKWELPIEDCSIGSSPAACEGVLYVGGSDIVDSSYGGSSPYPPVKTHNHYLYAFQSDGTLRWKTWLKGGIGPLAVGADGSVYVGVFEESQDGRPTKRPILYRINVDGTADEIFDYEYPQPPGWAGPISIGLEGVLYASKWNILYALEEKGKKANSE